MKRTLPIEIPKFKSEEEIAAFMERHSAFDLLDADRAEIFTVSSLVGGCEGEETLSIGRLVEKSKLNVQHRRRSR